MNSIWFFSSLLLYLCFFSSRQGENAASVQFQRIPWKWKWKLFIWLGGTEYEINLFKNQNFWIFGVKRLFFSDGKSMKKWTKVFACCFWWQLTFLALHWKVKTTYQSNKFICITKSTVFCSWVKNIKHLKSRGLMLAQTYLLARQ